MISLTDLRARRIVPAWQEAVAVVQELLQTVSQAPGPAQLPDVDHIALMANGEVVALPGSPPTGNPVRQAAALLQAMLDGAAAPSELRALVDDNAVESPKIASIAELSRQLAFFERPGRRSDVEQLVARAMSLDAQNRAEEELRRLKEKALESSELDTFRTEVPQGSASRIGRQGAAVLAFVLVGALVAGAWWLYARTDAPTTPDAAVEAAATAAPAETEPAAGGTPEAAADDAAPGTEATAGPPQADPPQAESSLFARTRDSIRRAVQSAFGSTAPERDGPPAAGAEERADGAPATPRPRRSTAARAAPRAAAGPAPAAPAEPPQISATITQPATEPEPLSIGGASEPASMVYSQRDEDVRPAILLRPLLPATPPPDVPPDQIGTLELIVDEQGDVESVRLISPSNRFHERMLVAHAKSWKFRPAIRDGRPVKYRTVVRLTI